MPGDDDILRWACDTAEAQPLWAGYAVYGRMRLTGQRAGALKALETFLGKACAWPFEERRQFCHWLGRQAPRQFGGSVCPEPLWQRLLAPTLLEWLERDPASPQAHLLAGRHFAIDGDPLAPEDHLRRALELDPACEEARSGLAEHLLYWVEYGQHHLPEGYIGDPAADLLALDEVQALVEAGGPGPERTRQLAEIAELRAAALDWIGRSKAP